jgi:hypothetical protein
VQAECEVVVVVCEVAVVVGSLTTNATPMTMTNGIHAPARMSDESSDSSFTGSAAGSVGAMVVVVLVVLLTDAS